MVDKVDEYKNLLRPKRQQSVWKGLAYTEAELDFSMLQPWNGYSSSESVDG
jgi:hypothetical protein